MKTECKDDKLSQNKINKLNSVKHWCQPVDNFDENYLKVEDWIKEHGKLPSARSGNDYEKKLAKWKRSMRNKLANNSKKLNQDQKTKLNNIGINSIKNKIINKDIGI